MNKKMIRIAGWALGLSMAVAGIGIVGSKSGAIETKAAPSIEHFTVNFSATDSITGSNLNTSYNPHRMTATSSDGTVIYMGGSYANQSSSYAMKNTLTHYIANINPSADAAQDWASNIPEDAVGEIPGSISRIVATLVNDTSVTRGFNLSVAKQAISSNSGTTYKRTSASSDGSGTDYSYTASTRTFDITIDATQGYKYFCLGGANGSYTGITSFTVYYEGADPNAPSISASTNGSLLITDTSKAITLTASHFDDEAVTYSVTSNPNSSIATASVSNDVLTLYPVAVGSTSLTVTGTSANHSATIDIDVEVSNPSYARVADSLSSLKVGSYITFANPNKSVAISKTATNGYRASETVAIKNNAFVPGADVAIFKLGLGTTKDTYTFYELYANGGYLYTTGSSYGLQTQANIDSKSMFTIGTPTSTGLVDIQSGAANHNYLKIYTKNNVTYFEGATSSNTNAAIYQYDCGEALSSNAITVTGTPSKLSYKGGQIFDAEGLTVTANLGSIDYDVTAWVDWSESVVETGDTSATGSLTILGQTVDVTYEGITVEAAEISEISIGTLPTVTYDYNGTLDLSNLVVEGTAEGVAGTLNVTSECTLYYNYGTVQQTEVVDGVTLTNVGTTTITVVYGDGTSVDPVSFNITVNPALSLDKANLLINDLEGTGTITATAHFAGAVTITAVSSNTSAATVSVSNNVITVTPVANGSSTVTVTATDGVQQLNAQCQVTVRAVQKTALFTYTSMGLTGSYTTSESFNDASGYVMGGTNLMKGTISSGVYVLQIKASGNLHNVTEWKDNISMIAIQGVTNVSAANLTLDVGTSANALDTTIAGKLASDEDTIIYDVSGAAGTNEFKYFRISASSYAQINTIKVTTADDEATAYATSFNSALASECSAKNVTSNTWTNQTKAFGDLSKAAKNIFVGTTVPAEPTEQQIAAFTEVEHAVSRHDFIVRKYAAYSDFMGRGVVTAGALGVDGFANNNSIPLVVTVAALGTAAAAGFFLFQRKRKEF